MIRETKVAERRTLRVPFPASLALSVGDLTYWDNAAHFGKPATSRSDTGSKAGNQADFAPLFLGVSADQRLSTETSVTTVASLPTGPSDRMVVTEGIFDCDCASATFEFGDLVGIDRDSTPLNTNQQVIGVAQPSLAIGFVVKREPTAVTKVQCFLSAHLFGWFKSKAPPVQGFVAGLGGAVTQITSASTGVTLSKLTGQITTVTQNIAAAGEVQFTVTNTLVAATDVVLVNVASGSTGGTTIAAVTAVAAGSFQVTLSNLHASTAETGTLVLNFVVIKGAAA